MASRGTPGSPRAVAPGESGRSEKISGVFPLVAAEKTIVFPSGAKRALKIGCCRNVNCEKEGPAGADLLSTRLPARKDTARAPAGRATAAAPRAPRRDGPGFTVTGRAPGVESPDSDSRSNARSWAE